MVNARASILIARPPETVFRFVAWEFFDNYRRWSPEVRRLDILTPGPIRVGSLARQVRIDHGRRSESTFRVATLDDPRQIAFVETRERFRLGYTLEPAAERTQLTLDFELVRLELHLRPFVGLIRSVVRDGAWQAVERIKTLVEAETPREWR